MVSDGGVRGGRRRMAAGFALALLVQAVVALGALVAVPDAASAYVPRAPIVINGNAEFTPANGVTAGSGTPSDPFIIEGWEIDGSVDSGIAVYNTDAHFVIRDVYLHSALIDAIFFSFVRNARIENAAINATFPVENDSGIYLQDSSHITVAASNISFTNLDSVVVDWSHNITIEGNQMWGNPDDGVFTGTAQDVVIRNNRIGNMGWMGIQLFDSHRVFVEGNVVTNSNMVGLSLDTSANITAMNNTFADNDFNVDMWEANDVLLRNNTVATSTSDGVTISGGTRIMIEENNITGNGGGVLAVGVADLLVRHNAFNGNAVQASDVAGANAWDDGYPSGGNYWSNYTGADNCSGPNQDVCPLSDGIGDTPFVIDGDSRDRYPLMQPFGTGRPGYTVTFIPPLLGDLYTVPWAVNATGAVVGWSSDGAVTRPFLYTDAGGTVALPVTGSRTHGIARDLNPAGVAAGELSSPDPGHAFRWTAGPVAEDLGVLGPGPMSEAWGVNATGAVVGASDYGGFSPHAFLYTDAGGMIDITPSQGSGHAYDVTDGGVVAGYMSAGGGLRAFRWAGGILEDLGVPAGLAHSFGFAVNEAGQVAGCADSASGNTERIARYTDGIGWEILGGAGQTNCAWGINAYGDVVGNGLPTGTGIVRAFLFTDTGGMQDLERMIDPALTLRLLDATDINDAGQVVGYAWDNTAVQYRGYRLDAVWVPDRMVIATDPMGLQVRVDGVDRTTPYSLECVPGSTHTVDAPAVQPIDGSSRHVFVSWSDGGARAHDIVCDPSRTVTAVYGMQYWLTMNATAGGVTLVPGSSWQDAGAVVAITCLPPGPSSDTRYTFSGWIGAGAGSYTGAMNPTSITMGGPIVEVCAVLREFRLILDTAPTGLEVIVDGAPMATPAVLWRADGSSLSIGTASPQYVGTDRYVFDRWSDGGAQTHVITCTAPATPTAIFLGPFAGNPSVTVIPPNGGEDWTGGSTHSISWTTGDDKDAVLFVTANLSTDGGATFPYPIVSGSLPIGVNTFTWALPLVDTTQARIRICARDSDGLDGCDVSDADFAIDSTPPILLSIEPSNGAVAVDPNASIVLTFSEPMDRATAEAAVTIAPPPGGLTFLWDGASRVVTVAHLPFAPGTTYTVTIDCGARDVSDPGNALAGCPVVSLFTTAVPAVTPQVTVTVPAGGEVWTGGTPHGVEWTMTDPDSSVLSVDLAYSTDGGTTWTTIAGPLVLPQGTNTHVWVVPAVDASAAVIRVCASDGALVGCGMSPAFAIDSTPPTVVSVAPPDGTRNVPLGAPIVVTLSEPMNPATFPIPGVSLAPAVTGLAGMWSPDGRTLTVSHGSFASCTPYAAAVDLGGSDLSLPGNLLTVPYTWSFSTVCPPTATLLEPLGGEDWTGTSPHPIRFRVGDETDLQVQAWLNLTVDGVISTLFLGLVSVGEAVVPWTVPSSSGTATIALTIADSSGMIATATSGPFAIDATPPALLTTDPADGAGSASVGAPLVLTFSEPMDRAGTEAVVAISPPAGASSFSWDPSGRILTVSFASPLAQFTEYVVTIGCGARDLSDPGNPLAGCPGGAAQLHFRTEIVTPPPVALAANVPDARVGEIIRLDGGASTGDIASWAWTITDAAGLVVATLDGATATHAFSEPGAYRVTLQVTDAFGRTDEYSFDVSVQAVAADDGKTWILAVATAAALGTILFVASEPGRVALVTATAGRLYGRKPKDEKDSEIRGAILYYVRVHPGDTYTDLQRNLGLNDGAVTYHLARLEKAELIRSAIRGARKRYYPFEMRVPLENGGELHAIQQRILGLVAQEPGMPVAFLAEQLGVSEQLALYHLRKLAGGDYVGLERRGFRLVAVPGTKKP